MTKIIAIHQPNFFPWLGYFNKISRADEFVFLDNVAYPKSGSGSGSWCNRVQVNIQGKPAWVGCPIRRFSGEQLIKDVFIDDSQPWRKKMLRTLELNYKKAPFFYETMEILQALILYPCDNLAVFNIHAIKTLCEVMNLKAVFNYQSELQTGKKSTELLIEIIEKIAGTAYLCGNGAKAYQQDELFANHNIELIYQNYMPTPYAHAAQYLPGLSCIDYLMHAHFK